jgi:hypothetical protein
MLTKLEALEECEKMWQWLADHPGCEKETYLAIYWPGVYLIQNCFACEYAQQLFLEKAVCKSCPVWLTYDGTTRSPCCVKELGGEYLEWKSNLDDPVLASAAALAIANLARLRIKELNDENLLLG